MKNQTDGWIEYESSLEKVEETVDSILCRVEGDALPNEKLFGLRLALHEAIANAITHGNRGRSGLSVGVRLQRTDDHIEVIIRDHGDGFSCELVPDPTEGENIFQCSGRGIFLMRKLVDEVSYNEKGNEVTLLVKHSRDPRLSTPPDSCEPS
jgi:serine/threonine-protein kinase RsbW